MALHFELVSPERILATKDVTMVVIPGAEGSFGVLEGHAAMVAAVGFGVLDIYADDMATITERFFVAGGIAQVTSEGCSLLADEAVPVADLKAEDLHEVLAKLEGALAAAEEAEKPVLEKKIEVTKAKIAVVTK